jgi:hypothetical protein
VVRSAVAERIAFGVVARDADGEAVRGLEHAMSVQVASDPTANIVAVDDHYQIDARAPDRAGSLDVTVRLAGPALPTLEASTSVPIVAGAAVRVDAQSGILTVGATGVVEVRGLDRFGNVTAIGNPTFQAEGARVVDVVPVRDALRIHLVPSSNAVRLTARGDYGLVDHVDLVATTAPLRPFSLGVAGTLRYNLSALTMEGGVAVFDADLPLGGRFRAVGIVSVGVEGGSVRSRDNSSVTLVAVPMFAHIGLTVRFARVDIGPVLGAGGWAVFTNLHTYDGDAIQQSVAVVGFSAAALLRVRTPVGRFWLQAGAMSGSLDTVPAKATLGGIYGQLGWSAGL